MFDNNFQESTHFMNDPLLEKDGKKKYDYTQCVNFDSSANKANFLEVLQGNLCDGGNVVVLKYRYAPQQTFHLIK